MRDAEYVKQRLDRYKKLNAIGTETPDKVAEIEQEGIRLASRIHSYRQELLVRGLKLAHLKEIERGELVSEIRVVAPEPLPQSAKLVNFANHKNDPAEPAFEVPRDLKIELGQHVQAGQTLCLLANHQSLFIEGRAFKREIPYLEKAAQDRWPVRVEFADEEKSQWPELKNTFTIRHLANTIDRASRTFAFYMPLTNQSRPFGTDGNTHLMWRFRPGQRVKLHVQVEEFTDVIVLPSPAVVCRKGRRHMFSGKTATCFERPTGPRAPCGSPKLGHRQ